jgi:hypothetical protein
MEKTTFSKKKTLFTTKLDLNLRQKLEMCYIWSIAFYGPENWTLRKVDQEYLESFEMWCWRRMEKISWTNCVGYEEVLQKVNEERNSLQTISRWKAERIGHYLRRNCPLERFIGENRGNAISNGKTRKKTY